MVLQLEITVSHYVVLGKKLGPLRREALIIVSFYTWVVRMKFNYLCLTGQLLTESSISLGHFFTLPIPLLSFTTPLGQFSCLISIIILLFKCRVEIALSGLSLWRSQVPLHILVCLAPGGRQNNKADLYLRILVSSRQQSSPYKQVNRMLVFTSKATMDKREKITEWLLLERLG